MLLALIYTDKHSPDLQNKLTISLCEQINTHQRPVASGNAMSKAFLNVTALTNSARFLFSCNSLHVTLHDFLTLQESLVRINFATF